MNHKNLMKNHKTACWSLQIKSILFKLLFVLHSFWTHNTVMWDSGIDTHQQLNSCYRHISPFCVLQFPHSSHSHHIKPLQDTYIPRKGSPHTGFIVSKVWWIAISFYYVLNCFTTLLGEHLFSVRCFYFLSDGGRETK